ncbi:MAG: hypothetical protein LLG06_04095 [Desulfobacteraceae bacterium]|nr:hypothetical protein [Desulfobacteraceae bacterium]
MEKWTLEKASKAGHEVMQVSWFNGKEIEHGRYGRPLDTSAFMIGDWLIEFDNKTGEEVRRYNSRYIESFTWQQKAA